MYPTAHIELCGPGRPHRSPLPTPSPRWGPVPTTLCKKDWSHRHNWIKEEAYTLLIPAIPFPKLWSVCTPLTQTRIRVRETKYNEWCYNQRLLQRTVYINKIRMLERKIYATQNAEEYYRPIQPARAHDVSGLPALIKASVIIFVTVCKAQLSV
jgi:hypothetical protein